MVEDPRINAAPCLDHHDPKPVYWETFSHKHLPKNEKCVVCAYQKKAGGKYKDTKPKFFVESTIMQYPKIILKNVKDYICVTNLKM